MIKLLSMYLVGFFLLCLLGTGSGGGAGEGSLIYKDIVQPFRMSKVNLIWAKAVKRLTEPKLKSLYTQLQIQDKEEIKLKRVKSDGQDKEGIMEANVRRKFKGILEAYMLTDSFQVDDDDEKSKYNPNNQEKEKKYRKHDNHINKSLFKDKKLNKLWEKAERGGFNEIELKLLKEEFSHHQEKLDEYYMLLETLNINEDKNNDDSNERMRNEIEHMDLLLEKSDRPLSKDKKLETSQNHLKVKKYKNEIKVGFENLSKKAVGGPTSISFSEPRVQHLWNLALKGNFTPEELSSLQQEMKHYEKRLDKLQHLQRELLLKKDILGGEGSKADQHGQKDTESLFMSKLKKHERTVEKLDNDLETKILRRHVEL